MSTIAERAVEPATVALALSEADVADLTDALLELRDAHDRLRRVDSLLSRLLAEVQRRLEPEDGRQKEGPGWLPRPAQRVSNQGVSDASPST